jgi:hypothetical protein
MRLLAMFPLFSEAGATFIAIAAALILIPSAIVLLLMDWNRKSQSRGDDPHRR